MPCYGARVPVGTLRGVCVVVERRRHSVSQEVRTARFPRHDCDRTSSPAIAALYSTGEHVCVAPLKIGIHHHQDAHGITTVPFVPLVPS